MMLLLVKIIILLMVGIASHANELRSININPNKPILSETHQPKLGQALELVYQTTIGQLYRTDIEHLILAKKIRLTTLEDGHYGESGEGCIISDQHYQYEGVFILLNEGLSIPELASSLIHEANHYRLIKEINSGKDYEPITIGELEILAFATQYEFIYELEQLELANSLEMFGDRGEEVTDIMHTAYVVSNNWSNSAYKIALIKLQNFGYPSHELHRELVTRNENDCKGEV